MINVIVFFYLEGVYYMKLKSVIIFVLRVEDFGYFDLYVFMLIGMC